MEGIAAVVPSTVITMQTIWYEKYLQRPEFLAWFDTEQEYIDAMFALMIMYNFGVWLDPEDMLVNSG